MKDLVAVGPRDLETGEDDFGVFVLVDFVDVLSDRSLLKHTSRTDNDASAFFLQKFFDILRFADSLETFVVDKIAVDAMRIVSDVLFGEGGGERRMTVDLFSFYELEFASMSRIYKGTDDLLKSLERETW